MAINCHPPPPPPPPHLTPPPSKKKQKTVPLFYLCCVMSVLNLNSLLSNILNYWRVLFLYIWCTFHWLKLWRLQSWGLNCGLQVKKKKRECQEQKEAWEWICLVSGEAFSEVFGEIWNEWWKRGWLRLIEVVEMREGVPWRKECMWGMFWIWYLESFTFEWRGRRLKFRLIVKAPDCVLVVSTLVYVIEIKSIP